MTVVASIFALLNFSKVSFHCAHITIDIASFTKSLDTIHDLLNFLVTFLIHQRLSGAMHVISVILARYFYEVESISCGHYDSLVTSFNHVGLCLSS